MRLQRVWNASTLPTNCVVESVQSNERERGLTLYDVVRPVYVDSGSAQYTSYTHTTCSREPTKSRPRFDRTIARCGVMSAHTTGESYFTFNVWLWKHVKTIPRELVEMMVPFNFSIFLKERDGVVDSSITYVLVTILHWYVEVILLHLSHVGSSW